MPASYSWTLSIADQSALTAEELDAHTAYFDGTSRTAGQVLNRILDDVDVDVTVTLDQVAGTFSATGTGFAVSYLTNSRVALE